MAESLFKDEKAKRKKECWFASYKIIQKLLTCSIFIHLMVERID